MNQPEERICVVLYSYDTQKEADWLIRSVGEVVMSTKAIVEHSTRAILEFLSWLYTVRSSCTLPLLLLLRI